MKRVLILGGGFAGGVLAGAAVERGWDVAVSTRTSGHRANLPSTVGRLVGDDADMVRWSGDRELIIDAAAPYALTLHSAGESRARRIATARDRMASVLKTARLSGAALIHIGSFVTSVRANGLQARLIHASHPYFAIKKVMRDLCLDAARNGQPVGVAEPSALFGPGDLRDDRQSFVAGVLNGSLTASPPDVVNVMDVRDMAEAVLCMAEQGWYGTSAPLSGHNITVAELAEMIAELGAVRPPLRLPRIANALPIGAAALYTMETAAASLGLSTPPVLPALLTLAGAAQSISPAQRALGVTPRPLVETITDEIAWRRGLSSA